MAKKGSFQKLIESDQPILIDFHATWCGPCKAMAPILKKLAEEYSGKAKVIKIDIDKNQALATQLQVRGVPTFILYKKGKTLWRQSGMQSSQQLKQIVSQHL